MFCTSCGLEIKKRTKFCPRCGQPIKTTAVPVQSNHSVGDATSSGKQDRVTLQEYVSKIDIQSVEQAKSYLEQLKLLFWLVFLTGAIISGLANSETEEALGFAGLLLIPYLLLQLYFMYFCAKVLKAERQSRLNVVWCIFFAPWSWLYLYPLLADPLKIVVGEKLPPAPLTQEDRERQQAASKRYWKWFAIVVGAVLVLFALTLVYITSI